MNSEDKLFSIVAAGAMNPRLHSPGWYRLVGLIDDSEMNESIVSPTTMAIPPVSQVQIRNILIICNTDKWLIQSHDPANIDRMKSIVVTVFDELLQHTPVAAMGFNFDGHHTTECQDVGARLAVCLAQLPLGFSNADSLAAELSIKQSAGSRNVRVGLKSTHKPGESNKIIIENNYEYLFGGETTLFKLEDTIKSRYLTDMRDAEERTVAIVHALKEAR